MISPSWTTYSLPSSRTSPCSRQAAIEPRAGQRVVGDDLGADEAALDVAVNLAGGELRRRAARDRPGAALVFADGEERHVAEQVVAGRGSRDRGRTRSARDRRGTPAASSPSSCAISSSIFAQSATALRRGVRRETRVSPVFAAARLDVGADVGDVGFVEVDDEQQRLGREELKAAQPLQIVAGRAAARAAACPLRARPAALHEIALLLELRRASLLQILLEPLEPPLGDAEVGEDQLVFHRLRVARRIDRARRMRRPPRRETRARRARARRRSCSRRRRRAPARRCAPGAMMSVNSTVAGTRFFGLYIAVSMSSRSSGTFEMPMLTSPLPRGASLALVISWKRVVLPLEGKPIRAARSMSPQPSTGGRTPEGSEPGQDRRARPGLTPPIGGRLDAQASKIRRKFGVTHCQMQQVAVDIACAPGLTIRVDFCGVKWSKRGSGAARRPGSTTRAG